MSFDPQRVEAALARAESPCGAIAEGDAGVLAAEVRRLREQMACTLGAGQIDSAIQRVRHCNHTRSEPSKLVPALRCLDCGAVHRSRPTP